MANNFVSGLKSRKFGYNSEFLSNYINILGHLITLIGYSSGNVVPMLPIAIIFNILSFFNIRLHIQKVFMFSLCTYLKIAIRYKPQTGLRNGL